MTADLQSMEISAITNTGVQRDIEYVGNGGDVWGSALQIQQ
jgi:hypothetical protein